MSTVRLSLFFLGLCLAYPVFAGPPPVHVPEELLDQFTLGGKIPVQEWYLYEPVSEGHPTVFHQQVIDDYIERIKRGESGYYGSSDTWLYEALKKYSLAGKEVGIFGSILPFYESVVLAYGGYPITVEYNKIVSEDPRIVTMTVEEFNKNPRTFDVILSVSSIEHDGLGRYGDPINPNADLEFMARAKGFLREGGRMFLAVPVGGDTLTWTAHRIYGAIRFPLLIKEWNLVDSFGFSEEDFMSGGIFWHQPILCLEPK